MLEDNAGVSHMQRVRALLFRLLGLLALLAGCGCGGARTGIPHAADPDRLPASEFWAAYAQGGELREWTDWSLGPNTWSCGVRRNNLGLPNAPYVTGSVVSLPRLLRGEGARIDFAPYVVTAIRLVCGIRSPRDAKARTRLTIVACWDESANRSKIEFIQRSGGPYGDSETLELTRTHVMTRPGARFIAVAYDRDEARLYVSDIANFEVLRVDDTDGDALPDALSPVPAVQIPAFFAPPGEPPTSLGIEFLRHPGLEGLVLFENTGSLAVSARSARLDGRPCWADSDGDGVMDHETRWEADVCRIERSSAFAGATEVVVDRPIGTQLRLCTLMNDKRRRVLGEELANVPATRRDQPVQLRRPLRLGERIGLIDEGGYVRRSCCVGPIPPSAVPSHTPTVDAPRTEVR